MTTAATHQHLTGLRQIAPDLWETRSDAPAPGLTTHAYLWRSPSGTNVLFYSVATDADFPAIAELGGVDRQYLSHRDEAGPMLARIREQFGAALHSSAAERAEVAAFAEPAVLFTDRHVDDLGIEVIPVPGHSPGSTAFLVPGAGGDRYLFTGDTMFVGERGQWIAGYLRGISDADAIARSIVELSVLRPDWVISSAYAGEAGAHHLDDPADWPRHASEAIASIRR